MWGLQYCSCVQCCLGGQITLILVNFDADEMQRHLEQCFENETLTPPPPPPPHSSLFRNVELGKHVFSDVLWTP